MRAVSMVLLVSMVGCADTTGPAIEEECRSAGPIQNVDVNGVKVDSSLVLEYRLCPVRETYQLPLEAWHEGR